MKFEEYYSAVKPKIDKRLMEIIQSTDKEVKDLIQYASTGGKRFRPVLCVLCCDVLNGNRNKALTYAAVIELIHCASLVSDDLIDGDFVRRGLPTFWRAVDTILKPAKRTAEAIFGKDLTNRIRMTVLTSHGMVARALKLLDSPEAVRAVTDSIYSLLKGATKEILHAPEYISRYEYIDIVTLKTSALFSTACYLGALAADTIEEKREVCREYGRSLGILYQVLDDLIDEEIPTDLRSSTEEIIKEYAKKAINSALQLPDNEYREAMIDGVFVILEKFSNEASEKNKEKILEMLNKVRESIEVS